MSTAKNHYVYCYIHPRTGKVFYYGKGTKGRKLAHLPPGKETLVRVIAKGLTNEQASIVETALIWKARELGEKLTNKIAGNYTDNFRPKKSLKKELEGFDFSHRSYFFNVGEQFGDGVYRNWDDCYKYGFLSTGWGTEARDKAQQLNQGDVVLAYISGHGYVGVGKVTKKAAPAKKFRIGNKSLKQMRHKLKAKKMCHSYPYLNQCEWVIKVKWLYQVKREKALKADTRKKHFVTPGRLASLQDQPKTQQYIYEKWGVKFSKHLGKVRANLD